MCCTLSAILLVLLLVAHTHEVTRGAEADADCNKKVFSCIQCSTDSGDSGAQVCRDPFDARVKKEFRRLRDTSLGDRVGITRYNISTVPCDGFCIKWIKIPMSGQSKSIVRTCSTSMEIRFSQNTPVCISESRTGKGTMCFCKDSLCNSATGLLSLSHRWPAMQLAFMLFNWILSIMS